MRRECSTKATFQKYLFDIIPANDEIENWKFRQIEDSSNVFLIRSDVKSGSISPFEIILKFLRT
jgi:hypothetical protein